MLNILKNKSGMTLLELIVGMMMFVIVATTVFVILVPMLKVYVSANELAEYNTLLDNVANYMVGDLKNATALLKNLDIENEISITIDDPDDVQYSVDSNSGVLLKNGTPVLSKNYYKSKSIRFSCRPIKSDSELMESDSETVESDSGTVYMLTVDILSDRDGGNNVMISREYAVRPLFLNQY